MLDSDATNYTQTPNNGYHRNQLKVGKPLIVVILTENASFRSYGTFAYLLRAHIRNINMRRYITSARGLELNGRVRAHIILLLTLGARARSEGYCSCPVCMCVHSYLPPHTLELQNRDTNEFIAIPGLF